MFYRLKWLKLREERLERKEKELAERELRLKEREEQLTAYWVKHQEKETVRMTAPLRSISNNRLYLGHSIVNSFDIVEGKENIQAYRN
jgi:hypothetical protein